MLFTGVIVVLLLLADVIQTAYVPSGAGFLTKWITLGCWKLFFMLGGRRGEAKILQFCGAFTLLLIFLNWIIIYWLGNFLIIAAHENSVVDAQNNEPVGLWDKLYFTGYSISTMGNGDLKAQLDEYRIYVSALSFSGFALISSAVTYFIPVLQADNDKRTISSFIKILGENPNHIILEAWNGKDLKNLEKPFQDLILLILSLMQKHIDYPIIKNFHNTINKKSMAVNLAILDETLSIIQSSIPEENGLSGHSLSSLQRAIADFVGSLREEFIKPEESNPPVPELDDLVRQNILVKSPNINSYFNMISLRRRFLLAYIKDEGWTWEDVYCSVNKNNLEGSNIN